MNGRRAELAAILAGDAKKTKLAVNYRHGTDAQHCGICTMFRDPHECTLVEGFIQKDAVCDEFVPQGAT